MHVDAVVSFSAGDVVLTGTRANAYFSSSSLATDLFISLSFDAALSFEIFVCAVATTVVVVVTFGF